MFHRQLGALVSFRHLSCIGPMSLPFFSVVPTHAVHDRGALSDANANPKESTDHG